MSSTEKRWRGLVALVSDAVVHGATAVERVHLATSERPFAVLEAIPLLDAPTRVVHIVHDATVGVVYGAIRVVTRASSIAVDAAIVAVDLDSNQCHS